MGKRDILIIKNLLKDMIIRSGKFKIFSDEILEIINVCKNKNVTNGITVWGKILVTLSS